MSALRLVLRGAPDQRLDLSALTPDRLAGLDPAIIAALPVQTTRRGATVADWFTLHPGDPADLVIEGGSPRLDGIGTGMASGSLRVEGEVGQLAGRNMAGGHLVIHGRAGDFVASGLRAGRVEVAGDVGDDLGGALPGERTGMRGGVVRVGGRAGARAGGRLRRGLLIIEGDAGPFAGVGMVAGTLIICGQAGLMPGILMRRGTIVLGAPTPLPPGFRATASPDLVFTQLLQRAASAFSPAAAFCVSAAVARSGGDLAVLGKGEWLFPGVDPA